MACERRVRNGRAKNSHSHGCMRSRLLCYSVSQFRVGLFIRGCTSSLCAAKPFLQSSRIIPGEPVVSWPVHTPLVESLTGSAEHDKGQWLYLVGRPQSPRHSATGGLLWYFPGRSPAKRKLLVVRGRLFGRLKPTLLTANYLSGGRSLIRNPRTGSVAGSSGTECDHMLIMLRSNHFTPECFAP